MHFRLGDTIAAVATPPGEGGIAVIRISGPDAAAIGDRIFVARGERSLALGPPFRLRLGAVVDPSMGEVIDEVLAVRMPSGRSYTGEATVEIHSHGGRAVVDAIVRLILSAGARHAGPGEFTKRAFLSGRMDLAQAEAVADVIRADSDESLRAAQRHLNGELGNEIRGLRGRLLDAVSVIEALIDLEDDEGLDIRAPVSQIAEIEADLLDIADRGIGNSALRGGTKVTIAGRPNTGKSSLFNALCMSERSIVTPIPGTTRDFIEERALIDGIAVTLVDTAGIRRAQDEVEAEGVRRSLACLEESSVIVVVIDGSAPVSDDDVALVETLLHRKPLVVESKADLPRIADTEVLACRIGIPEIARVSSSTGEGIRDLLRDLSGRIRDLNQGETYQDLVPRERHRDALLRAAVSLRRARHLLDSSFGFVDQIATELRAGLDAVGEITGETASEEIIDSIFARFCVGK